MLERLREVTERVAALRERGFERRAVDTGLEGGGATLGIESQQAIEARRVE